MAFRIYFSVDIARALQDLQQLRLDDKITDMAKTVRVSLHDAAERSARQHIGGTFGDDLARGVRSQIDGNVVTVDHKSNDNTHIAEHVHSGGVIRPRNRKYLAIPTKDAPRGEWASDHNWATPNGKPVVIRDPKAGLNGRAYLAEPRGKRGKLKFLYTLVRQTKPQRPRPWWPTDQEFEVLTARELEWHLNKLLPNEL